MPRPRSLPPGLALAWGLAALTLVIAFVQRFGEAYLDSRIELTTEPGLFLERVAAVWSPTTDLGHVQSGQFVGYLFPMGPWFAATDALGVPPWISERLWLALVLWAGAWGVVCLLRALYRPEIGPAHAVAALVFLCNPYVVVYVNRSTVTLLAYAALPWLLLAVHRGLRDPRGWRWPAVAALAIAAGGAGANAAVLFWVALAPLALVVYELVVLRARGRAVVAFGWRALFLVVLSSLWWIVPLGIQSAYGADLLGLSEKPETIWGSTTMAESLRLLGLWISYYAGGFGEIEPASKAVDPLLFSRPVIVATFALPLAAFAGVLVTRRWRFAPFFGLLAVAALVVMSIGYPLEKRSAKALLDLYYDVPALQFLRTTYKAAPLVAISMACLIGVAAGDLASRWRERHDDVRSGCVVGWAAAGVVLVLAGLPLFTGRAIERDAAYGEVPASWPAAMRDAERATPADRRIMVLPGQQFSAFRWGRTMTPLAPALTRRPVLQRSVARTSGGRAAQLQDAVDDLVQQRRLVPGQLTPLLEWLGVGQVIVAADGWPGQSAEAAPTAIADALRGQPGFDRPAGRYGPSRVATPAVGDTGARLAVPALRRYDTSPRAAPVVRLKPLEGTTVLEGDGNGLAALAAAGRLDARRAVFYAGDLTREQIAEQVRSGADLVLTDSHRHQILNPSNILGAAGPILTADVPLPKERPSYGLFDELGSAARTVAVRPAFARLDSPASAVAPLGQENRPEAAVDGRLGTSWFPPDDQADCICLELTVRSPRPVSSIRVHPRAFGLGSTVPLGVSVDGGAEDEVDVAPQAWNDVQLPVAGRTIRLRTSTFTGRYGLDEVQIPGVRTGELLRLPTRLASETRGQDLSRNAIAIELLRTTTDAPTHTDDGEDPEAAVSRSVLLPVARRFASRAGRRRRARRPTPCSTGSTGLPPGWRFASSGRLEGVPGWRASSAFDGRAETAWVADSSGSERPWLSWHAPRPVDVRRLRLVRGPEEYGFPQRLDVVAGTAQFDDVPVAADGVVTLPRTVRGSDVRLEVTRSTAPRGRALKREVGAVAVAEIEVPGLDPPRAAASGPLRTACGALTVRAGAARATARVTGTIEALNAGDPLRVAGCGPQSELTLGQGSRRSSPGRGATVPCARIG